MTGPCSTTTKSLGETMKRGTILISSMLLATACAHGEPFGSGRAGDLQQEYSDRKDELDDCMSLFGDCLDTTEDNAGISDCAEALQVCLAEEPQPQEDDPFGDDDNGLPGDDPDQNGMDPDQDGMDPDPAQPDDGGVEDQVSEICDPILQQCLDDPTQFDPFCLDDFQECVEVEVALELQDLCQDVQAQCLELDIPNFDCFDLCS